MLHFLFFGILVVGCNTKPESKSDRSTRVEEDVDNDDLTPRTDDATEHLKANKSPTSARQPDEIVESLGTPKSSAAPLPSSEPDVISSPESPNPTPSSVPLMTLGPIATVPPVQPSEPPPPLPVPSPSGTVMVPTASPTIPSDLEIWTDGRKQFAFRFVASVQNSYTIGSTTRFQHLLHLDSNDDFDFSNDDRQFIFTNSDVRLSMHFGIWPSTYLRSQWYRFKSFSPAAFRADTGEWLLDTVARKDIYAGPGYISSALSEWSFSAGDSDQTLRYGASTDQGVVGDWTNQGTDRVGVLRGGTFYLSTPSGDLVIPFGSPGDIPVAGRWNHFSKPATVGVFRPSTAQWMLETNGIPGFQPLSHSNPDTLVQFGAPGDEPIVFDWNGDGRTKIGVRRGSDIFIDFDGSRNFQKAKKIILKNIPNNSKIFAVTRSVFLEQLYVGDSVKIQNPSPTLIRELSGYVNGSTALIDDRANKLKTRFAYSLDKDQQKEIVFDTNGDLAFDKNDRSVLWGQAGSQIVPGRWDYLVGHQSLASVSSAAFQGANPGQAYWYIDRDGDMVWDDFFGFGVSSDIPLRIDLDGMQEDYIAMYRKETGKIYVSNVRDRNAAAVTQEISTTIPQSTPFFGHWARDSYKFGSLIEYKDGRWYVPGTNTTYNFGQPGDIPIVGDWNADGVTDIGVQRGNTVYLDFAGTRLFADARRLEIQGLPAGAKLIVIEPFQPPFLEPPGCPTKEEISWHRDVRPDGTSNTYVISEERYLSCDFDQLDWLGNKFLNNISKIRVAGSGKPYSMFISFLPCEIAGKMMCGNRLAKSAVLTEGDFSPGYLNIKVDGKSISYNTCQCYW